MRNWGRTTLASWGKSMKEQKVCILLGSPRKNGNTIKIVSPFISELEKNDCVCDAIWLYDKKIFPCLACRTCQQVQSGFGCPQQDDMQEIFDKILDCDLLVLATPIYSWYCTPPMKSLLDRLVYGMNKYYGEERGSSLWTGKKVALITTCGYPVEKGADLLEAGIKRYCKHSRLHYIGMLVEHDDGYRSVFMNEEKRLHAVTFAQRIGQELLKL